MKTLIAAALLLALTTPGHTSDFRERAPGHASKFRESDRKWLPTVHEWANMYRPCIEGPGGDDEAHETEACKIMYAAQKKLIANGYCVYADGGVGRPSKKDQKYCYAIDWPIVVTKKWYLTVTTYTQNNRGGINWDQPETAHLNRAFDTRGECLALWRTFHKQCGGLIADNSKNGYSVAKFIGHCRRHSQQPEPVLALTIPDHPMSSFEREGFQLELECAK